jgi:hypothetical protein
MQELFFVSRNIAALIGLLYMSVLMNQKNNQHQQRNLLLPGNNQQSNRLIHASPFATCANAYCLAPQQFV